MSKIYKEENNEENQNLLHERCNSVSGHLATFYYATSVGSKSTRDNILWFKDYREGVLFVSIKHLSKSPLNTGLNSSVGYVP